MTVKDIKRQKKHDALIVFDNGESHLIDISAISEMHINVGTVLDFGELEKLKKNSEYQKAKSRALWLIDYAEQTEKGLYDKLVRAGFDKNICAEVISKVKNAELINDEDYAERYALRCSENGISKKEAVYKLTAKGIKKEIAQAAAEKADFDENSQIRMLIKKKYKSKLIKDPKNTEKVFAALARKGFSFSAIREELKNYSENLADEEDFY